MSKIAQEAVSDIPKLQTTSVISKLSNLKTTLKSHEDILNLQGRVLTTEVGIQTRIKMVSKQIVGLG